MPALFAGYLIRIKPLDDLNPVYLNYYLNSPYAKQICNRVKTDAVNQSNINSKKLGNYEIPVPTVEEQEEIARLLDNLLSKETEINDLIDLEYELDLLEKSILSKAFRGELGTNDPDDELAEALLKKILEKKKQDKPKVKVRRMTIKKEVKITDNRLYEEIKKVFPKKQFTFEEINARLNWTYDSLQSELFDLVESDLLMAFDKERKLITFQLKTR